MAVTSSGHIDHASDAVSPLRKHACEQMTDIIEPKTYMHIVEAFIDLS